MQTDQSFSLELKKNMMDETRHEKHILAAGMAPHASSKAISSTKTKHKKSAKKASNVLGPLSQASTAIAAMGHPGSQ